MEQKSHVAQVAAELEKLGFTAAEADHLAREKHRAHADLVKNARRDPGEIAEEIMQRETEPGGQIAPPAETVEDFPAAPPGSTPVAPAISAEAQLDAFEQSIPKA